MEQNNESVTSDITGKFTFKLKQVIYYIIVSYLGIEALLVFIDVFFGMKGIVYIPVDSVRLVCDMARNHSIFRFFAGVQIFFVGITIFLIFFMVRGTDKKRTILWFIQGAFFVYMGIDDSINLHQTIGDTLSALASDSTNHPFLAKIVHAYPSYYWQIALGPFFFVMGIFTLSFLFKELKGTQLRRYVFIALLCYVNAVFLDFLHGTGDPIVELEKILRLDTEATRHFIRIFKRYIEMLGTTLFWYVFLSYLANILDNKKIIFTDKK
jgi:hypothetical protein